MSSLTETLVVYVQNLADTLPLYWFAFIESLIEDLLAPIPSPLVMTLAGTLAKTQGYSLVQLIVLLILSALAKTIGGFVLYELADKIEDLVPQKIWKLMGVSHDQIEKMGEKISKGHKDEVVLFVLRAIPAIPSLPISLAAGILKIELKTYLLMTFLGTLVKNSIYLLIGYSGAEFIEELEGTLSIFELAVQLIAILAVVIVGGVIVYQRRKKKNS